MEAWVGMGCAGSCRISTGAGGGRYQHRSHVGEQRGLCQRTPKPQICNRVQNSYEWNIIRTTTALSLGPRFWGPVFSSEGSKGNDLIDQWMTLQLAHLIQPFDVRRAAVEKYIKVLFFKHSTTPVVLSNEFILFCVSDGKVLV